MPLQTRFKKLPLPYVLPSHTKFLKKFLLAEIPLTALEKKLTGLSLHRPELSDGIWAQSEKSNYFFFQLSH